MTASFCLALLAGTVAKGLRPEPPVCEMVGNTEICGGPAQGSYSRDAFGSVWLDIDGDCLDTREELLVGAGARVRVRKCEVVSGTWVDGWTGQVIRNPRQVTAGHVYALRDAWEGGADTWDQSQRVRFANDPSNLVTATPATVARIEGQTATGKPCRVIDDEHGQSSQPCVKPRYRRSFAAAYRMIRARFGLNV